MCVALCVGGPDLLAVDDPLVADELSLGTQRGEIGAGIGLREALRPDDVPAQRRRDELLLLRPGAPFEQRRHDQLAAARDAAARRARAGELFADDLGADDVRLLLRTAKVTRHAAVKIALIGGSDDESTLILTRLDGAVGGWPVRVQELSHLRAEGIEFRPEAQVHLLIL